MGGRLRIAAAFLGLDAYEMARLVGTDAKTMGLWMRGEREPRDSERLQPVATALGVTLESLLTGASFLSIGDAETDEGSGASTGDDQDSAARVSEPMRSYLDSQIGDAELVERMVFNPAEFVRLLTHDASFARLPIAAKLDHLAHLEGLAARHGYTLDAELNDALRALIRRGGFSGRP